LSAVARGEMPRRTPHRPAQPDHDHQHGPRRRPEGVYRNSISIRGRAWRVRAKGVQPGGGHSWRKVRMPKEIFATIGIDIDAVAGWIGSYGGADSPYDIQRGVWAGEVGTPRLLKLFEKYDLKTSWFIPGHSIETFPDQVRMVAEAGTRLVPTATYTRTQSALRPPRKKRCWPAPPSWPRSSPVRRRAATSRHGGRCDR
jgi:hypothetical protein